MRSHRTMALAATLSIAAGAAVTDLPPAFSAQADVSYAHSRRSDEPSSAAAILAGLRECESSGDYTSDNHDGYYGAYQFDVDTWQSLGYEGNASQAPPAVQDQAVRRLYARSGWAPWPACSTTLGLAAVTLPEPSTPATSTIAVVPLTPIAVVEPAPPAEPAPAAEPPRPRRFRDLVAEFG